jgi:hypothetical protein
MEQQVTMNHPWGAYKGSLMMTAYDGDQSDARGSMTKPTWDGLDPGDKTTWDKMSQVRPRSRFFTNFAAKERSGQLSTNWKLPQHTVGSSAWIL